MQAETDPIALMMVAISTSEESVNLFQTAWYNIPLDSHLHTRRQNVKSHHADEETQPRHCEFML
jgi:hypothetical protein